MGLDADLLKLMADLCLKSPMIITGQAEQNKIKIDSHYNLLIVTYASKIYFTKRQYV